MKIGTSNAPNRLAPHDLSPLKHCDIILGQEHTDNNDWSPPGFKRYRPTEAQSNTHYWNPDRVDFIRGGAYRLSSKGFRSKRVALWVVYDTEWGRMRVIGVHLPAFYNDQDKNGEYPNKIEYDKQIRKLAAFIEPFDIVGGDFNGQAGNKRMKPLEFLDFSAKKPTGPHRQPIDYVAANRPFGTGATELITIPSSDHDAVAVDITWRGFPDSALLCPAP